MKFVLFLAAFVVFSLASSDVLTITKENFEDVLIQNELVLVKFYAPWCGHCKTLLPEFEEAATTIKTTVKEPNKIVLAEINCDEQEELCQSAHIEGFPTLYLYRRGINWQQYEGDRKAKDIVEWCMKMTVPLVFDIEDDEKLVQFKEGSKVLGIAYIEKDTPEFESVAEAAAMFVDKVLFARVAPTEGPKFEVYKSELKQTIPFEGDITNTSQLVDFIDSYRKPVVVELDRSTFRDVFHAEAGPIGILFIDPKSDEERVKEYSDLAVDLRDEFPDLQLTTMDGVAYEMFLERLGHTSIPGFSIVLIHENAHFNLPEYDVHAVPQFVRDVVDGKVEKYVRSEDPPAEEEQGAARTVVRSTFDEEVIEAAKNGWDVLCMFHAPFCGHCRTAMPIIEDLAFKLHVSNAPVKVVLFNADANDIPESSMVSVEGFPTIVLYSFEEGEIKTYTHEGDRSIKNFLEFLNENSKKTLPEIIIEDDEEPTEEEPIAEEYDEL